MMPTTTRKREGAALVIVLGFLAILTVLVIAFSTQTRTERLAGRAYLANAQTRHLLHAALARAMEDIDVEVGTDYPAFFAMESRDLQGDTTLLRRTINFDMEEDYFPAGNSAILNAFDSALDNAEWRTIQDFEGAAIGRVGYVIINTSGLLDANHVGGALRGPGLSPREIQLPDTAASIAPNRDTEWRRYETLRDVQALNSLSDIADFSTFSFSPPDSRIFMGNTPESVAERMEAITNRLGSIGPVDAEFVYYQLLDYVDTDTVPSHERYGVEAVPLINEVLLTCEFTFDPIVQEEEDAEGNTTYTVVAVAVTNNYEFEVEAWFPFYGASNDGRFSLRIKEVDSTLSPTALFSGMTAGKEAEAQLKTGWSEGDLDDRILFQGRSRGAVWSLEEATNAFSSIKGRIEQLAIECIEGSGEVVDLAENLELRIDDESSLIRNDAILIIESIFGGDAEPASETFTYKIGLATVDPRLNWDGQNPNHWVRTGDDGDHADSMGESNTEIIEALAKGPEDEPREKIYVRNSGQIDSPYEFTYLLYNTDKPWQTFQFFKENDPDGTRRVVDFLHAFRDGVPPSGRVNAYTPHTNVLASLFVDMPKNTHVGTGESSLPDQSTRTAELLMAHVATNGWSGNPSALGSVSYGEAANIVGASDTWTAESFLRHSVYLLTHRDTLYTILLVAQGGADADRDGAIADDEVLATQKAVAYIWRDPVSGKAAVVFWGLSDTLQSSIGGGSTWGTILQAFRP